MTGATTRRYLPALDGLRFLCVVAIVLYHFVARYEMQEPLPAWITLLTHRLHFTDIFFILSGFLMMHCYGHRVDSTSAIRTFYSKRLMRVYPAHLAMLGAFVLFVAVLHGLHLMPADAEERYALAPFVRQLLLVQAWWPGQQSAWNYPSWAVSAALGCFLLFPWLAQLLQRSWQSFYVLTLSVCLLILAGCYVLKGTSPMTLTFDTGILRGLMSFLLGMVLWHGWASGRVRALPRWGSMALVVAIMVIMTHVTWPPELLLPAYLLLIGGLSHTQTGWLAQLKPLGKYSYTLLLTHALTGTVVLGGAEQFLAATPTSYVALYIPLALMISLTGAVILYHWVEQPAQQWLPVLWQHVWQGRKQQAVVYHLAPPAIMENETAEQPAAAASRTVSSGR